MTNTFAVISLVAYIAQHDPKTLVLLFSYTFASHVQKHFVHTVGSEAKGSNSNFANFTGERKNIITLLKSVEFS